MGHALRRPRWTLRLKLTLLYGALFLVAGAVLLTITYELVANSSAATGDASFFVTRPPPVGIAIPPPGAIETFQSGTVRARAPGGAKAVKGAGVELQAYAGQVSATFRRLTAAQRTQIDKVTGKARLVIHQQQSAQLAALLTRSGVALGIMALISIGLGWLVAGRALRPIRVMSNRARGISDHNLHERLALDGPDDELKELGDTFDELLGRLESAFESQRRFVANASHELRTPITLERTLVEVALADPAATSDTLKDTCRRVLSATEQQERMIDALLTLARSQRGLPSLEPVRLDDVVGQLLESVRPEGVRIESDLEPAMVFGERSLLDRLVGNVIENALLYNDDQDGWVAIWTGVHDGRPGLRVANRGPVISDDDAGALTEPFRRLGGDRTETRGAGLGLSIVAAIAEAHGAKLSVTPREQGGLEVAISFAPPPAEARNVVPLGPDVAVHR